MAGFPVHFAPPPNSHKDRIASPTLIARSTGSDVPPSLKAIVGETKRTDASEIMSMSRLMDLVTDHGHLAVASIPKGMR